MKRSSTILILIFSIGLLGLAGKLLTIPDINYLGMSKAYMSSAKLEFEKAQLLIVPSALPNTFGVNVGACYFWFSTSQADGENDDLFKRQFEASSRIYYYYDFEQYDHRPNIKIFLDRLSIRAIRSINKHHAPLATYIVATNGSCSVDDFQKFHAVLNSSQPN